MVTSDQILIRVQLLIVLVSAVDIGLQDICGTKLVGTCPETISVKVKDLHKEFTRKKGGDIVSLIYRSESNNCR